MAINDGDRAAAAASPPSPRRNDSGSGDAFLPDLSELGAEGDAPPAYSEFHDHLNIHQAGFDAGVAVTDDGRVNININQSTGQLADFLAPTLRNQLRLDAKQAPLPPPYIPPNLGGRPGQTPPPPLNLVIQIVGSRGDVQPFIALGQVLKKTYGHRVRVATHPTFQKFVEENGLEFFSIGADPAELMAFMVKHPGLMPGIDALKNGEITKRRLGIEQIVTGCWRSCIESGDGLGPPPRFRRRGKNDTRDPPPIDVGDKPFVADAIIANPPSFAHIHIAEKLGVPLHLMFTMPWSPTRAFPQPLANIQSSNTDPVTTNYLSYAMVEMMTWQGLGDIINRLRTKVLGLDALSLLWAPGLLTHLRIPYTYCWSPALIPKPNDWGSHIDVAGFYFLNLASSYTPDPDLAEFLAAGPPPIYIGFGSIVVEDPDALTKMIFDAVRETGVRALVSKGWGGLGANSIGIPDSVYMLGNVPHGWLFKHVSAVCHHGGAGTTAAGIQAGKPTIIVPFFGDQPFWGAMVSRAGAGPDPIPYKELTTERLAEAIRVAIRPETQEKSQELGDKIREERGADVGGQCFHKHIDIDQLRCAIVPSRVAVWRVRRSKLRLSALAAATLVNSGYLQYSDLKLFRAKEYNTDDQPTDPISACTSALVGDLSSIAMSAADFPRNLFAGVGQAKSKATDNVSNNDSKTEGSPHNTETVLSESAALSQAPVASDASSDISKSMSTETWNTDVQGLNSMTSVASSESGAKPPPSASTLRQQLNSAVENSELRSQGDVRQHIERAVGAGKSINNIVTTGVKSPMNLCMSLARGFRNAPNLYNDDTIRPVEKVTSFSSGLKVAGKEFGFGLYDGITGMITQPLKGAEKGGGAGLLKGLGKGVGGLVLKPSAAFWSIPAYTMAGVHAEIRNLFAQNALNYIVASRIAQGKEDLENSSAEERDDIQTRWPGLNDSLSSFNAFKKKQKGKAKDSLSATSTPKQSQEQRTTGPLIEKNGPLVPGTTNTGELDDEYEEAIQTAVQQTSTGDSAEDARLEHAMRSSIGLMGRQSAAINSEKSHQTDSAHDQNRGDTSYSLNFNNITDEEYRALIAQAMKVSLEEQNNQPTRMHDGEQDDDSFDDEEYHRVIERSRKEITQQEQHDQVDSDDEELQKAIQASQLESSRPTVDDDEDFKRALEASEKDHQAQLARMNTMKSEEEIVMEYVKKQSLAEAEFLKTKTKGKGKDAAAHASGDNNDEELQRALEESLKTGDGDKRGGGGGPSQFSR
ncbi:hypothetical protein F5Y16DRAFT_336233 [Xylariaceae sp. FL0255]|nr:hypothetical protein F5Y16DRAFT_336233 [Xylariaceae sp. FL0255]